LQNAINNAKALSSPGSGSGTTTASLSKKIRFQTIKVTDRSSAEPVKRQILSTTINTPWTALGKKKKSVKESGKNSVNISNVQLNINKRPKSSEITMSKLRQIYVNTGDKNRNKVLVSLLQ